MEQPCWSDIAVACGRRPPVLRCFATLNLFWHKWSGYAAICANMRAAACGGTSGCCQTRPHWKNTFRMLLPAGLRPIPASILEERLSREIAPAVAQAHADIGVLADLAGAEGLETYPFRIDRLVVVVPRSHVLAQRRNIAFVEVLDEEFVGLAAGNVLAEYLAWQSARLGRSLKLRIRLRRPDAVCRMVERGVGIAVVPETAALRCRRTMALGTLRLTDLWATRQLIVCVRRLDALPAHARRLVEHLAETARTETPLGKRAGS